MSNENPRRDEVTAGAEAVDQFLQDQYTALPRFEQALATSRTSRCNRPPPFTRRGILDYAHEYIRRGWKPVPIPTGRKAPLSKNWPRLRITETDARKYFDRAGNIGVILGEASGGLVDVDLDSPDAIMLAPQHLPATNSVFGRASKLRSHWLYYVSGWAPTLQFKDPLTDKMLVELRGDTHQTVFPGSVHQSGEIIKWAEDGPPADVDYPVLRKCVTALAAHCLIKQYFAGIQDSASFLKALDSADPKLSGRLRDWLGLPGAPRSNRAPFPNLKSLSRCSAVFAPLGPRPSWLRPIPGHPRLAERAVRCFALNVLNDCIIELRRKKEPGRADLLFRKSIRLGILIARGHIERDPVADALFNASVYNGLVAKNGVNDVRRQIEKGFTCGLQRSLND